MKTFYDILDAHPNDDAESLKVAFRKAVKACHPDLNFGDPDAPVRFVQIMRAKVILSDPELRAAYDRMLEFEREQLRPTSKLRARHSFVADAIVVVFLAVVLAGAYTLFTDISENTLANKKSVTAVARQPANVTAARVQSPVAATIDDSQRDKFEGAKTPKPNPVAPTAMAKVAEPLPSNGLAPDRLLHHAKFFREQGVVSYHNGDVSSAITDFDLAIRLDPDFENAYVDRGIALYRIGAFNRAFADIAQAMRIENSRRTATPSVRKATPQLPASNVGAFPIVRN
jgi:curved DNA-binding protein CbpA